MKKNLQTRLESYKASIAQKETLFDLKKIGLSSAAALAAIVVAPVELTSQVVCGNQGAPTRTVGNCIGDLNFVTTYYNCAFFDFDGDGINELQVLYYYGGGVLYAGEGFFDPLGSINMHTVNLYLYAAGPWPQTPVTPPMYFGYHKSYVNRIYYLELSGGGGFGFITFDADHYPVGMTHPVTGHPTCCRQLAAPVMWGAQTGITFADLLVTNPPVADESNLVSCAVLPVELSRFEAKANERSVSLEWSTETEVNNSGFSIERSTDGKEFKEVAFVDGQGTSSRTQDYSFEDKNCEIGVSLYYRLRQIDYDGGFAFSELRYAKVESDEFEFSIAPNPAQDNVVVDLIGYQDEDVLIEIYTISGALVLSENRRVGEDTSMSLDISDLSGAMYFIKITDSNVSKYKKLLLSK